jgi:hypothetical protein
MTDDDNNKETPRPKGSGGSPVREYTNAEVFKFLAWMFVAVVVIGFVFHLDQR